MASVEVDNKLFSNSDHIRILVNYYIQQNNNNYKKTIKGLPDMRDKDNRRLLAFLVKQAILKQNKEENKGANIIEEESEDYRKDIINLTEKDIQLIRSIQTASCSICYENINASHTHLECGHFFCSSCIIQHGRNKNNCPICRAVIKDVPLPHHQKEIQLYPLREGIVNHIMSKQLYSYKNDTFKFKEYLEFQFDYYHEDKEKFISEMMMGIEHLLKEQINHIERIL